MVMGGGVGTGWLSMKGMEREDRTGKGWLGRGGNGGGGGCPKSDRGSLFSQTRIVGKVNGQFLHALWWL